MSYSLCCISLELKKKKFSYQTMTRKKFLSMDKTDALKVIGDKTLNNLNVLYQTLLYCSGNKWNMRIGSDLIPLLTLPQANFTLSDLPQYNEILYSFRSCAELIKSHNIRCSMHPDQFVVLASDKLDVSHKSILEINNHAYIMDLLELPANHHSPINIHMNCFKNQNLDAVVKRFADAYIKLQDSAKQRLVIECEDKKNSWNVQLLYDKVYLNFGVSITYDSHHHRLNSGNLSPVDAFNLAKSTWGKYKPLFHFSNGKKNSNDKSHSDYVREKHDELFDGSVDIEFEFKMKDLAIKKFEKR